MSTPDWLNATLPIVSFSPAHRAAARLAERLAAARKEPRVFCAQLEEANDSDRFREAVANATFSVITGAPAEGNSLGHSRALSRSLAELGLQAEFVGCANSASAEEPKTPVAILRTDRPPVVEPAPPSFRVGAIITAYNEADIIADTLKHLATNGIGVYLIDNWSTDGSLDKALALDGVEWLGHERFPEDGPSETFEWARLLQRVEAIASRLDVDWLISNDADEFRYAPWPGVTLRDAVFHVDRQGFNAVNHTYLNFELTEDTLGSEAGIERLSWFRPERADLARVNCWQHERGRIEDIASSGNHVVRFSGRAVFPYNFLCKHYPMRSLEQAERKVFRDRLPRFLVSERLRGWHSHYDKLSRDSLIRPTEGLNKFDESFDGDYILERLTGVGFDPPPVTGSPKIRVARVLRRLGVLDRALALRWRITRRAAR